MLLAEPQCCCCPSGPSHPHTDGWRPLTAWISYWWTTQEAKQVLYLMLKGKSVMCMREGACRIPSRKTSSWYLANISFANSLDLQQKTEQLGNTGRYSTEKHEMRHTQRKQSKVRYILKTFGDIIEHHLWDIIFYHFYTRKKSIPYTWV